MSKLPVLSLAAWRATSEWIVRSNRSQQTMPARANATLTHSSWGNFILIVLKSIKCPIPTAVLCGRVLPRSFYFSICIFNRNKSLTSAPVWFWCIHQDEPCEWNWSPPRRESRRGHWPVPQGQTASYPEQHHCSLDRRGHSGKNHSPSRCWWLEAAERGRRSPHFLCEGFLGRRELYKWP